MGLLPQKKRMKRRKKTNKKKYRNIKSKNKIMISKKQKLPHTILHKVIEEGVERRDSVRSSSNNGSFVSAKERIL